MGDPRKRRRKFSKPTHPWQKERIEEEKELLSEYGLKNKRDLWKSDSLLRNFKRQAKRLITLTTKQAEVEGIQLLKKLVSLGLLEKNAKIEDVLSINLKDILERRLQTTVHRKKLTKSIEQARQFIVHRHVAIGDKVMSVPSYLVSMEEEGKVNFTSTSSLFNEGHPARFVEEKKPAKRGKAEKKPRKSKKGAEKKQKKETKEISKEAPKEAPKKEAKQEKKSESKPKKKEEVKKE